MKEIIELSDKTITIERNAYLKEKGSVDRNIYYVEQGSVKLFIADGANEQIIRFGYKGNLIAALDSFLTGKPSPLLIQAIKKTVVRVISTETIKHYLSEDHNKGTWIKVLEQLVLQQLEREVDILTNTPKERYRRALKRSPQLFQEIPSRHIANYLRMSPETLSRLKSLDSAQDL